MHRGPRRLHPVSMRTERQKPPLRAQRTPHPGVETTSSGSRVVWFFLNSRESPVPRTVTGTQWPLVRWLGG